MRIRSGVIFLLLLAVLVPSVWAQAGYYNPKDDEYRLLGLRRAQQAFEAARSEMDRQQELFNKQLIAEAQFEEVRRRYAAAEVDYHQSLLAVIFEQQYVSIDRAVKFQDEEGRKRVRLTIRNTSGGGAEYQKLLGINDELFRRLQPDVVNDVYVSLLNDEGAILGRPYEAKIEELRFGEPQTLTFTLLQDLDAISVNLVYGGGSQHSRKILLEKDASFDRVVLQSQQFAQEVELGREATYDLTLELFSGTARTFHLVVLNLPAPVNRYFVDPATQARLSQFRFTEGVNTRPAALRVVMPQRPTDAVPIDEPRSFFVLAVPRERMDALRNSEGRIWTEEEIAALGVGYVRLELVPRGAGDLLVRAPQLYHQIEPDGTVTMLVDVVNEGTRRLDNVTIDAEPPLRWEKEIDPPVISALDIGEEQRVQLRFRPYDDVEVGKYEVRVRTTSFTDNRPIATEDKIVTVEVRSPPNWFGTALLLLLIVGLVAGLVVFGLRLSKR